MKINHTKFSKFIPKNRKGRQLVILDIHGCLRTFRALLKKIQLTKNDQLFLLGDYINKGKDSKGVLDLIIELKEKQEEKGFQIFPLRGNHEQMFIEYYEEIKTNENQREAIEFSDLHYNFTASLPYFYELDDFILVHAGFNLENKDPFLDIETMLWKRDFSISSNEKVNMFYNKTIIIGHNPTFLDDILQDVDLKMPSICLDNGCVYNEKWFLGSLLCLDLNTFKVKIQKNIEN